MTKIIMIGWLVIAALAAPGALAQGQSCAGSWRERMAKELDLTEEQKDALSSGEGAKWGEMKKALNTERQELNEMLRNRSVSDAEIRDQLRKVEELEKGWNARRLEKMLRARKVLTDEQLKKLLEMHETHRHCQGER